MAQERIEREVIRQWRAAADALAEIRAVDLSELSDAEALDAADRLLQLLPTVPPPNTTSSGLVEQQRRFSRVRT